MLIGQTFIDRDLDGRPVASWFINGSQPEHVLYMRRLIDAYRRSNVIRQLAAHVIFNVAGLPAKARRDHALALGQWVQDHVRYMNEGQETFQTPIRTLRNGFGDCDDHTILICALLEATGIPSKVCAMEWGGAFRHVFPAAILVDPAARRLEALALDSTLTAPAGTVDPLVISKRKGRRVRVLLM